MPRQRGNRWQGDALVNGERKRLSFATFQEAQAFEANPYAYLGVTKSSNAIGSLFPVWGREIYGRTRNARNALRITDELVRRLGSTTPVEKIDRLRVKALIAQLQEEGNADSTVNTKLAVLSRLLGNAVDERILEDTPAIPFRPISRGRVRALTKDEEDTILSHLKEPYSLLASFLLYTGCRVGEALSLQWQDVADDRVTFWRTKTDKPRTVPLTYKAKASIIRLKELRQPKAKLVFPSIVYSTFLKKWRLAKQAAGLSDDRQVVPHVLRHTCATRLGKGDGTRKMDPLRLSQWLGHSTLDMTRRYTHLDVSDLVDGSDILDS